MAVLRNSTQNNAICEKLEIANSLFSRMKGLLGRDNLPLSEGLWIHDCRSIHTLFMRFPIDLIFVSKDLVVTRVVHDVRPGRLIVSGGCRSRSVIEMAGGALKSKNIKVGDQLHVDC